MQDWAMSPSVKSQQAESEAPVAFPCCGCGNNLKARRALAGKIVKCPRCGSAVLVPASSVPPPSPPPSPTSQRRFWIPAGIFLIAALFGCSIYANLSFTVTNGANYQYFPPFKKYVNDNDNKHLGAEYFNIARSMAAGEGFSSPWNNEK